MGGLLKRCVDLLPSSKMGRISVITLSVWVFIAIFSPFIANDKPILAKSADGWSMPIFSKTESAKNTDFSFKINPLIAYKFDNLDLTNSNKPPFANGKKGIHILGTDLLGRDILAGMVNGARVAFIVSTSSILFSVVFGIFIGLVIGFYGDNGIKRNLIQQLLLLGLFILFIYYSSHLINDGITIYSVIPFIIFGISGYLIHRALSLLPLKKYGLPIDMFVQRLFEINESVPGLFIILAFVAVLVKTSLFTISMIMAFLIWMTFALHARSEAIKLREEDYIQSARASGLGDIGILIKHILPNALPSLLVVIAFSFSGVILLESTLSFLGIGLPLEEISWGKILAEARKSPKSWWLAVFPGLAIFLVLFSLNTLGDILANYQRKES